MLMRPPPPVNRRPQDKTGGKDCGGGKARGGGHLALTLPCAPGEGHGPPLPGPLS